MTITSIRLTDLRAHPLNANAMKPERFAKLVSHIGRSGRYPPLIVRAMSEGERTVYQVLDGHHRWQALAELGEEEAMCTVWAVDDAEALLLLSTLNRLEGDDDPGRRARLLDELQTRFAGDARELGRLLPEGLSGMKKLASLLDPVDLPRPARAVEAALPVSVHFFLTREQQTRLEARLRAIGGSREAALMRLIEGEA